MSLVPLQIEIQETPCFYSFPFPVSCLTPLAVEGAEEGLCAQLSSPQVALAGNIEYFLAFSITTGHSLLSGSFGNAI